MRAQRRAAEARRLSPHLNDVRILKLAEMYEAAFARLLAEMSAYTHDDDVRGKFARLFMGTRLRMDRIGMEILRLSAKIGRADDDELERCAIQDVHETERAARAFYLRHVEEVRDPDVADLFRALAHEGRVRVRVAEDALGLHDRRVAARRPGRGSRLRASLVKLSSGDDGLGDTRLREA